MKSSRSIGAAVAVLLATVLSTAVVTHLVRSGETNVGPSTPRSAVAEEPEQPTTGYPLDDVPGLGVSPDAALRDEVISYWEAWQRDTSTHRCMLASGFQWFPEVAYPEEVVLELADALEAPKYDGARVGAAPESKNAAIQEVLTGSREEYFQALYGESAEAIDHAERTGGVLPPGRDADGFAEGGCTGQSQRSVGSIWDLDRSLAESLDGLTLEARQTAAFEAGRREYRACASEQGLDEVDHPEDLEKLDFSVPATLDAVKAVEAQCTKLWDTANDRGMAQAAVVFRITHATALEEQRLKYGGVLERIQVERDFLDFLGRTAARIRFEAQQ